MGLAGLVAKLRRIVVILQTTPTCMKGMGGENTLTDFVHMRFASADGDTGYHFVNTKTTLRPTLLLLFRRSPSHTHTHTPACSCRGPSHSIPADYSVSHMRTLSTITISAREMFASAFEVNCKYGQLERWQCIAYTRHLHPCTTMSCACVVREQLTTQATAAADSFATRALALKQVRFACFTFCIRQSFLKWHVRRTVSFWGVTACVWGCSLGSRPSPASPGPGIFTFQLYCPCPEGARGKGVETATTVQPAIPASDAENFNASSRRQTGCPSCLPCPRLDVPWDHFFNHEPAGSSCPLARHRSR